MIQVGDTFNRLEVIKIGLKPPKEKNYSKKLTKWCMCKCTCGEIIIVPEASLRNGNTGSCGCLRAETARRQLIINKEKGIILSPRAYKLTADGKTQSLTEWAKEIGISKQALSKKLQRMSLEEALKKARDKNEH